LALSRAGISTLILQLKRELPAQTGSVRQLRLLAVAFAEEVCDPDDQLVADVALCVSEAATNVVRHAYGDGDTPPRMIELAVCESESRLVVQIRDNGSGTDRAIQPGTGLHIISQLADTQITHTDTGTVVTMSFPCEQDS
jgi:anti-sigma regulatory factor (Ser/Thr protein kinase)